MSIRTTHDGGGRACGIVTGMGATPQLALEELRREGKERAQQAGQALEEAAQHEDEAAAKSAAESRRQRDAKEAARIKKEMDEHGGARRVRPGDKASTKASGEGGLPASSGPREWRFEVVDVRLTPALMAGGGSGWLAYGTLAREGHPRQVSTTGAGSGSSGGGRGGPGGRSGWDDRGGREGR